MCSGAGNQCGCLPDRSRTSRSPITANWCPIARAALSLILKHSHAEIWILTWIFRRQELIVNIRFLRIFEKKHEMRIAK